MILREVETGFVLGLFATASPCVLPLYPGFLAYLAAGGVGPSRAGTGWLGLVVLAGVLTTMLALGALMALLAVSTGSVLRFVTPLADLVVVALGVLLLTGHDPFARLPALRVAADARSGAPLRSAYVYGVLYGPIALPCSAPLLVALFGLGLGSETFLEVLVFFLAFGLGFGVPLLVLSLLARGAQASLVRLLARHHDVVMRAAGVLLIAVGVYDLASNVPFVLISF
ncbi:MAG TPA: cytochrome c biogenesis protein CcdA [Candidatus Limnocylindria bacterium]|nr:cytochrome c biogenesis protein CcdA [Candidatus Limnocylindria bacterium]